MGYVVDVNNQIDTGPNVERPFNVPINAWKTEPGATVQKPNAGYRQLNTVMHANHFTDQFWQNNGVCEGAELMIDQPRCVTPRNPFGSPTCDSKETPIAHIDRLVVRTAAVNGDSICATLTAIWVVYSWETPINPHVRLLQDPDGFISRLR